MIGLFLVRITLCSSNSVMIGSQVGGGVGRLIGVYRRSRNGRSDRGTDGCHRGVTRGIATVVAGRDGGRVSRIILLVSVSPGVGRVVDRASCSPINRYRVIQWRRDRRVIRNPLGKNHNRAGWCRDRDFVRCTDRMHSSLNRLHFIPRFSLVGMIGGQGGDRWQIVRVIAPLHARRG